MAETTSSHGRLKRLLPLAALLVVAAGLRLWGITAEAFWFDEVTSLCFTRGTVWQVLDDNARDVHPPLFYLGLYSWRILFGTSSAAALPPHSVFLDYTTRAYSIPWSLLGILAIFLLARDIGGKRAGWMAAGLGAVNAYSIYYAQEARMYAQTAALGSLGSWCLWRWIAVVDRHPHRRHWWRWSVAYTACAVGTLLSHYMGLMILLAQGIFALLRFARKQRMASIVGYSICALAVVLAFLPWYFHVMKFRGTLYVPALDWIQAPGFKDVFAFPALDFFWAHTSAAEDFTDAPLWLSLLACLFVAGSCVWVARKKSREGEPARETIPLALGVGYMAWLVFGPVLIATMDSLLYHPIYHRPRFCTFVLPPFLVLCGIACCHFRRDWLRWGVFAALACLMFAGTVVQRFTQQKTDVRSLAEMLRQEDPQPPVLFFPHFLELQVEYYTRRPLRAFTQQRVESILPSLQGKEVWVCHAVAFLPERQKQDLLDWLAGLGETRVVPADGSLEVTAARVRTRTTESSPRPPEERIDSGQ